MQTTNRGHDKIDFDKLLKRYSTTIYPLFLWSVFLENSNNSNSMTLSQFCNLIKLGGSVNIHNKGEKHFMKLAEKIAKQISILESNLPHYVQSIQLLQQELSSLELTAENVYLFIQGHTLHDGFVLPFLKSLYHTLKSEEVLKIRNQCSHENERENALNHYQNSLIEPEKSTKN